MIELEKDKRYQAERKEHEYRKNRRVGDSKMVEHWVPPDTKVKAPANGQKMKIPKVKEPKDSTSKKSSESSAPCGMNRVIWLFTNTAEKVTDSVCNAKKRAKSAYSKFRGNKVAPVHTKVQNRHLELEPLCCLSSCLVRGGCSTVVVFELCYVVLTTLCVLGSMFRDGFSLWSPLPSTFNQWFGHHLFYYTIIVYDIALAFMSLGMARGLFNFDKWILRAHFFFCYFSVVVNLLFLAFSVWALVSPGPLGFSPVNCLLIFCFVAQVPLQLWAATVVKSCHDFFALIHVFVALAEA